MNSLLTGDDIARGAYLNHGQGLADSLLGGRTSGVAQALGRSTGLGVGGMTKMLALLAPLVLGAIARTVGAAPTAGRLQSLMSNERPSILAALPPGLASLFGLSTAAPAAMAAAAPAMAAPSGMNRFLPWIVAAILAALLLFALRAFMGRRPEAPAVAPPTVSTPNISAPTVPTIPKINLRLPGGASIDVPEGSIGYTVARFLESNEPVPKTFVFDNLNYDTASNALTPESQPTVAALAAILKAYPNVQGRVVGFTDNQGDPAANKTLSDARAATVKRELVNLGISADRIETAGMGEESPIADNATEDGRAKNRRTELTIVKK
jgi:outer membrane protein OmpA-like peptidoglycan-associated protein